MNIVTICDLDGWMQTHLARWVYLAKQTMPDADLHLVVPVDDGTDHEVLAAFASRADKYFVQVKFVPKVDMTGRLLYYDRMRAGLPNLLGLDEMLYADPDIDFRASVESLQTFKPDKKLLWVANPVELRDIRPGLKAIGRVDNDPLVEEGFLYLRGDLLRDFDEVLTTKPVDRTCIAPGMIVWTELSRRSYAARMPDEYNTTMRAHLLRILDARTLHFTGNTKKQRPHYSYEGYAEHKLTLNRSANWYQDTVVM